MHRSLQPDHNAVPIAVISNGRTPYGVHLFRRIVRELPSFHLSTLYTHDQIMSDWKIDLPPEINPVLFGPTERAENAYRPRFILHEWRKGGRIIRWLKDHAIRSVLLFGYSDPGRLRILRWCRINRVPCMLFGDSNIKADQVSGYRAIVKKWVVGWSVRQATVILPTGSLGRQYFEKYGARPDRIFYLPYEPDYDLIGAISESAVERARVRFGLRRGRRYLIYSGRLQPIKRVDLAINAFAAVAAQRPEWDLIIMGSGPLESSLRALVPAVLERRVLWTGFVNDQDVVGAVYRASDVLILPSEKEPWALVVNEAAAAGLAIISSDVVGAAAELVRDGVNGRIFRSGDVNHLTECLLAVTAPGRTEALQAASGDVLAQWRHAQDPIDNLKQALTHCGLNHQRPARSKPNS